MKKSCIALKNIVLSFLLIFFAACPSFAYVVVLDPGHGGKDPGAIGKKEKEKNINLRVALRVGQLITGGCPNVKVIYTRKNDVFIPLDDRADIANKAKADLFISIHTNALAKGRLISGAETYSLGMASADENLEVAKRENSVILYESNYQERYAGFNPKSSESYIIFDFMQDEYMKQSAELAKLFQKHYRGIGRMDKGVHQAGFLVLRKTSMPSVLTELGFISTPSEENYLSSAVGIEQMANCIYQGFRDYLSAHTRGNVSKSQEKADTQVAESAIIEDETNNPLPPVVNQESTTTKPKQTPQTPAEKSTDEKEYAKETQSTNAPNDVEDSKMPSSNELKPVFKVQFYNSSRKLKDNAAELKGLKNVNYYKEGETYKYTYGKTSDYQEIIQIKKKIAEKFKDCFVVAFKGTEKISVADAKNQLKK